MTTYTLEKFENGVATVRYTDDSWAELVVTEGMTQEDFDDLAYQFRPKTGINTPPAFLNVGDTRTAIEKPQTDAVDNIPQWLQDREAAYGTAESQIEYITENGIEAWQTEVASIKTLYPKPTE